MTGIDKDESIIEVARESVPTVSFVHGDFLTRLLPGARYRRHLLWRYSLIWTKPA